MGRSDGDWRRVIWVPAKPRVLGCKLLKNKTLKVCFLGRSRDKVSSDFEGRDLPAEIDPEQGLDVTHGHVRWGTGTGSLKAYRRGSEVTSEDGRPEI